VINNSNVDCNLAFLSAIRPPPPIVGSVLYLGDMGPARVEESGSEGGSMMDNWWEWWNLG